VVQIFTMQYIDTAIAHVEFAIKLMQGAEDGSVTVESLDKPLSIEMGHGMWVLPDRVLTSQDELINACQNFVTMAYGAAAITLNRCREEMGVAVPQTITTECDQWVALVYQIRNAFAHDIAEPRWHFTNPMYDREYRVRTVVADLRGRSGQVFDYAHIGGEDGIVLLKQWGAQHGFGAAP
jgi:hypothetical protein